jgi:hypothetical protein
LGSAHETDRIPSTEYGAERLYAGRDLWLDQNEAYTEQRSWPERASGAKHETGVLSPPNREGDPPPRRRRIAQVAAVFTKMTVASFLD